MDGYIRILSDSWDGCGKIWYVKTYQTRPDSTGIELTLVDSYGNIDNRVVSKNQIEWCDEE